MTAFEAHYLEAGLDKGLAGNRLPHNKEKYCREKVNHYLMELQ